MPRRENGGEQSCELAGRFGTFLDLRYLSLRPATHPLPRVAGQSEAQRAVATPPHYRERRFPARIRRDGQPYFSLHAF
jgi:hypothetical protein